MKQSHWDEHPHVRSGDDLSMGEKAADRLKATFGSWGFLIALNTFIAVWVALELIGIVHFDPFPFILLNLGLSWLAAQQGGALQIAANRGDRISAELAMATHRNTQALMEVNKAQLKILERLEGIEDDVEKLAESNE